MNSIVNACLSARATFSDQQEVHRLWRYLNLLHVSAYCGMTDYLTKQNFFLPLCEKHKLLGEDGFVRAEELSALDQVGLDESGARACSMYQVWCYEVLKAEQKRSGSENFSAPIHAQLSNEVKAIGDHIKRLFAYRFQVLPFIYTHLVSASSTLYLLFTAFTKGLYYHPDATFMFGFLMPFMSVAATALITFGVLEVGNTVLDPFGDDAEDFALLHFVEYALCASCEAIKVKPCGIRLADRKKFYSLEEVAAAKVVVRKIIKRFRWQRLIKRASMGGSPLTIPQVCWANNLIEKELNGNATINSSTASVPPAPLPALTTRNSKANMSLMF